MVHIGTSAPRPRPLHQGVHRRENEAPSETAADTAEAQIQPRTSFSPHASE